MEKTLALQAADWFRTMAEFRRALTADGTEVTEIPRLQTVAAAGDNSNCTCNAEDRKDIIAVDAGYKHTIGLRKEGTAVAVGDNEDGQCDVSSWTDIKIMEYDPRG